METFVGLSPKRIGGRETRSVQLSVESVISKDHKITTHLTGFAFCIEAGAESENADFEESTLERDLARRAFGTEAPSLATGRESVRLIGMTGGVGDALFLFFCVAS